MLPDGYLCERIIPAPELGVTLHIIGHRDRPLKIFWIQSMDPENCFMVSFPTIPNSSSGTPHILEHLVLCGSKHYPVKDPFFAMSRRTLATFLNAMTGDDFTCYPASSQNKKDFYNLFSIYLDAIFFPLLEERDFCQEGWRLEFTKIDDPSSDLVFRGVVFNEMKQHLSRPISKLLLEMDRRLFAGSCYAHESGGIPKEIPHLSYKELLDFYKTFYHPSLATFYFYGDIPIEEHLTFLEKELFDKKTWDKPKKNPLSIPPIGKDESLETINYAATSKEDPSYFAIGYRTAHIDNEEDLLALKLLDEIWMGHDGSPLKAPLLESGLTHQFDSLFDSERITSSYLFLAEGVKDPKAFEAKLNEELEKCASTDFSADSIDRALYQLQFELLEITRDHYPYGIELFFHLLPTQHGIDPEKYLNLGKTLRALGKKAKNPGFFAQIIRQYFLINEQKRRLFLSPDPQKTGIEQQEEKDFLASTKEKLSSLQKEQIVSCALAFAQEKPSDLSCLPSLTVDDLHTTSTEYPLIDHHHSAYTNGISYVDLILDSDLDSLCDLSLLLFAFPELGTKKSSYDKRLEFLDSVTGDFSIKYNMGIQKDPSMGALPFVSISASTLDASFSSLYPLIQEQLFELDLQDKARIKQLLQQLLTSLERKRMQKPLDFALLDALSQISPYSLCKNQMNGTLFYEHIKKIAKDPFDSLQTSYEKLKGSSQQAFVVTSHEKPKDLPTLFTSKAPQLHKISQCSKKEMIRQTVQSPVATNVFAIPTINRTHADASALFLAAELIGEHILHPLIREKGGAYGGRAQYLGEEGALLLFSYADPQTEKSFAIFHDAAKLLRERSISEQELFEAKIAYFQQVDKPIAPKNRALFSYTLERKNITTDYRNRERNKILDVTKDQLFEALEKHWIANLDQAAKVCYAK